MAVSEEVRLKLYEWVVQSAGREVGAAMMDLLPPTGWGDVATKRDVEMQFTLMRTDLEHGLAGVRSDLEHGLAGVRTDLEARTEVLRHDTAALVLASENRLHQQLNRHVYAMAGIVGSAMAVAVGAVELL